MTRLPKAMTAAAALLAAAAFAGAHPAPARAADQPACSAAVKDHCVRIGAEAMAPSPEVKGAQEANVQTVEDKAREAGDAVVAGAKEAGAKVAEWGREVKANVEQMINGEGESSAEKPGEPGSGESGTSGEPGAIPHGCSPATTPCE